MNENKCLKILGLDVAKFAIFIYQSLLQHFILEFFDSFVSVLLKLTLRH